MDCRTDVLDDNKMRLKRETHGRASLGREPLQSNLVTRKMKEKKEKIGEKGEKEKESPQRVMCLTWITEKLTTYVRTYDSTCMLQWRRHLIFALRLHFIFLIPEFWLRTLSLTLTLV